MIIQLVILTSIACQTEDINFGAFHFDNKPSVKQQAQSIPSFPAQILPKDIAQDLPKVKKPQLFRKTDKFGRTWEQSNPYILNKYVEEINKKPFTAIDKFGQIWESQDKDRLNSFIEGRNNLFDSLYNQ